MGVRIIEKLKNQQGSSLAFVLIIGMIIMIMVASLLAVANSDFTFTQQTVESRQAYIDAKSVIEYGKIEIDSRIKNLNAINIELYLKYQDYKAAVEAENLATAQRLRSEIDALEARRVTALNRLRASSSIHGDIKKVSETLSENTSAGEKVGELTVTETGNQFKFIVETENLRRKLDYTISFSYDPAAKNETPNPGSIEPGKPIDNPVIGNYAKVMINATGNNKLKANIQGKGNDKEDIDENGKLELNINYPAKDLEIENKFEWINGRTLNMFGKNILVSEKFPTNFTDSDSPVSHFNFTASGELRFKEDYYQKNKGLNQYKADNVVFDKNVKIGDKGVLEIRCKNLFIKGNLELESANSKIIIHADNIVITGTVKMASGTTIETNCENIWFEKDIQILASNAWLNCTNLEYFKSSNINVGSGSGVHLVGAANSQIIIGNITTQSSAAKLKFENINYLKTGNMNLEDKTELTVTGAQGKNNNAVICGDVKPPSISTHSLKLNMTNLAYCIFDGLELDQNCTALISSNFVRFKNTYKQFNGDVIIKDADNVVFNGGIFDLDGNWNSYKLRIESNNIYLDADIINIRRFNTDDYRGFVYLGKSGQANTNLHLKQPLANWSKSIAPGKYSDIGGDFPRVGIAETYRWLYDLEPTVYVSPSWSDPTPGSGGSVSDGDPGSDSEIGGGTGGTSVSVTEGAVILYPSTEKYY